MCASAHMCMHGVLAWLSNHEEKSGSTCIIKLPRILYSSMAKTMYVIMIQ